MCCTSQLAWLGEKTEAPLSSSCLEFWTAMSYNLFCKLVMLYVKIGVLSPVFLGEGSFHSETVELFSDFQLSIFLPVYAFCW